MKSRFLGRHFAGKVINADRIFIENKLFSLESSDVEVDIDDFVRLFMVFIFNYIIFSTSSYITPSLIFPYMDDHSTFLSLLGEMLPFDTESRN